MKKAKPMPAEAHLEAAVKLLRNARKAVGKGTARDTITAAIRLARQAAAEATQPKDEQRRETSRKAARVFAKMGADGDELGALAREFGRQHGRAPRLALHPPDGQVNAAAVQHIGGWLVVWADGNDRECIQTLQDHGWSEQMEPAADGSFGPSGVL